MPKYLNSNRKDVMIGQTRAGAGETVTTNEQMVTLPAGVTVVSVTPFFDPVIQFTKITSTQTVRIPDDLNGNYKIKIYVGIGEVSLSINQGGTLFTLGLYDSYEVMCMNRTISAIDFQVTSGTAYMTIFKI